MYVWDCRCKFLSRLPCKLFTLLYDFCKYQVSSLRIYNGNLKHTDCYINGLKFHFNECTFTCVCSPNLFLVLFKSVSFRFAGFVSFRLLVLFGFVLFRMVLFRFDFLLHFTGTLHIHVFDIHWSFLPLLKKINCIWSATLCKPTLDSATLRNFFCTLSYFTMIINEVDIQYGPETTLFQNGPK